MRFIKHLFIVLILFAASSSVFADEYRKENPFVMTCKIDCVNEKFSTEEGRDEAIAWFKSHRIGKVYLESYRHGFSASSETLRTARDAFQTVGIECGGCVTTTKMSRTIATEWGITTCFSDPTGCGFLAKEIRRSAEIFDVIILDDFFFQACKCPLCLEKKGDRSWTEARCGQMAEVAQKYILEPAREVNPKCKIIIKYPCWIENLQERGYDVLRESALLDYTFVGTETREGGPQPQACWYMQWVESAAPGKCLGGWFDPLSTEPKTFVEQARETILGGAVEPLLHCYDYLATENPGIAVDRDSGVKWGRKDADAFQAEVKGLVTLYHLVQKMQSYGVLLPKKPNEAPAADAMIMGKIGLLGIPTVASVSLDDFPSYYLTPHASHFENLDAVVSRGINEKRPILLTSVLFRSLSLETQKKFTNQEPVPQNVSLLRKSDGSWESVGNPLALENERLDEVRNALMTPFGVRMYAPQNVALHLFLSKKIENENGNETENETGNETEKMEVIENFREEPITVRIFFDDGRPRTLELALPTAESGTMKTLDGGYELRIDARSAVVLKTQTPR